MELVELIYRIRPRTLFPAAIINGEIRQYGKYPTYEDLEEVITQIQGGNG
jgi:hypothetical protein